MGLTVAIRVAGLAPFAAYPSLTLADGGRAVGVAAALAACALLPFADRRGIRR